MKHIHSRQLFLTVLMALGLFWNSIELKAQTPCTPTFANAAASCTGLGLTMQLSSLIGCSGSITDAAACNSTGYFDRTSLSVTLQQGVIYSATMVTGSTYYSSMSCQVWIDFNNDGTFQTSESVGGITSFSSPSRSAALTIPSGASTGSHRMRVVGNYADGGTGLRFPNITPCPTTAISYGEARDYTVVIAAAVAAISGTTNICTGSTTTLTNATSGGLWSSNSPTVAAIGSLTGIVSGVTAGTTTITYQIPGGCSATTTVVVNTSPTSISGTTTLCRGATTTLSNGTSGCRWSSSNTGVATIGSASGTVVGVSAGTSLISYTCGGCVATTVVTINPAPAAITGATSICLGATTTLNNTTPGCRWSSSNTAVATIGSSSGVAIGVATGTTLITYQCGTCISTLTLTVNAPEPMTGITGFYVGDNSLLSNASPSCIWSSSNTGIASVGSTGIVHGVAVGTAIITYNCGSCFVTDTVRILPLPPCSFLCNGDFESPTLSTPTTILLDDSVPCWHTTATDHLIRMRTGADLGITPFSGGQFVEMNCTGNSSLYQDFTAATGSYITVSLAHRSRTGYSNGMEVDLLTPGGTFLGWHGAYYDVDYEWRTHTAYFGPLPYAPGHVYRIYLNSYNIGGLTNGGNFVDAVTTTIINPPILGNTTICAGGTTTLTDSASGCIWSSSNTAVATIGSSTGIVVGISSGTSVISYTCGGCVVTTIVTVNAAPASITGATGLCTGATTTFSNATTGCIWSSSNTAVATIGSATGIALGVATGTSVISYSCGVCVVTTTVTVNSSPGSISGFTVLCPGTTTALSNATPGCIWSSSNTTVASIGSTTGNIIGVATGTSIISYICGSCMVTTTVTVSSSIPISGPDTLCAGASVTESNIITCGTWSSSNTTIATIGSTTGIVTGVASGTAIITYNTCGGCISVKTVVVLRYTVPTIAETTFCEGASSLISGPGCCCSWTSSNTAVALPTFVVFMGMRIDFVIGVSAGTAVLTFSCGLCSTTTTVTVISTLPPIVGTTTMCVGGTASLTDSLSGCLWSSCNMGVATVGSVSGIVSAVSAGTAIITYGCGPCYTTTTITVVSTTPISGPDTLCTGTSATLTADSCGTWSSSNTSVATIGSATGILVGVFRGTATITFSSCTDCIVTKTIVIGQDAGTISGATTMCISGFSILYSATTFCTWSSSNTAVATVSPFHILGSNYGMVVGVSAGTTIITYGCGPCLATTTITVLAGLPPVTGDSVICVGDTTNYSNAEPGCTWSSDNSLFATVDPVTGIVTGVNAGSTTISYTCGTCTVSRVVTVLPPGIITGILTLNTGTTTTLGSIGSPGCTWSSSTTGVATVGSTGIVYGVAAGTSVITYSCGSCYTTAIIYVVDSGTYSGAGCEILCNTGFEDPALTGDDQIADSLVPCWSTTEADHLIEIWTDGDGGVSAQEGNQFAELNCTTTSTLYQIFNAGAGSVVNVDFWHRGRAGYTNDMHVSVGPVSGPPFFTSATFTAVTTSWTSHSLLVTLPWVPGGNYRISFVSEPTGGSSAGGNFIDGISATISLPAIIGNTTICAGSTTQLSDSTSGCIWVSSNSAVASVGSSTGLVNGVSAGTAVITYGCSPCYVTTTITVVPVPGSISGADSVCAGSFVTLTNSIPGGTWTSSDITVASVVSGVVTGVLTGTAIITYSTSSACFTTANIEVISCPCNLLCDDGSFESPTTTTFTQFVPDSTSCWKTTDADGMLEIWNGAGTGRAAFAGAQFLEINSRSSSTVYTEFTGTTGSTVYLSFAHRGRYTPPDVMSVHIEYPPYGVPTFSVPLPSTSTTLSDITGATTFSDNYTGWRQYTIPITLTSANARLYFYTISSGGLPEGGNFIDAVTVGLLPPIMGDDSLCIGAAITLTDSAGCGTWSSSAPGVATVDSIGAVIGYTSGTAIVTYTGCSGCYVTKIINVNTCSTLVISGADTICYGSSTTMTTTDSCGTWTSSSPFVATIGSATGVVIGVSSGTTIITFTPCTGTFTTTTIYVLPQLGPINGPNTVCVGSSVAETIDSSICGTWSSSNNAVATIGSTSGIMQGHSVGVVTITYLDCFGCHAIKTITVTPTAAPITGPDSVCVGNTIVASDATPCGTWSSSDTTVGSIRPTTGIFIGHTAGTVVITYTPCTGCIVVRTITVLPQPSAIAVQDSICVGSSVTATSDSTGCIWVSSNTAVASVGSSTGLVNGVSAGTAVITYGCSPCYVTTTITVVPMPGLISGADSVCSGSFVTLTNSIPGGTWTSSNITIASVVSGVVTGVLTGTAIITYSTSSGCFTTASIEVISCPCNLLCDDGSFESPSTSTYTQFVPDSTSCWKTTDSVGMLEIWNGTWSGIPAFEGAQFLEINARSSSTVYTEFTGTIGSTVYLSFAHRGRYTPPDVMSVHIEYPPYGVPTFAIPLPSTTTTLSDITGATTFSDNYTGWRQYTIPITLVDANARLYFHTISSGGLPNGGNFIDGVTISFLPPILGDDSLCIGAAITLTDSLGCGTWSSSAPGVATVDSIGAVIGYTSGTAIITYTGCSGCYVTKIVNVTNCSTLVISGADTICYGSSTTMTTTDSCGTWTSSSPAVATIGSATGVVNGLTSGTTIITFTPCTGAIITNTIYVRPRLGPINGPNSVCVGSSVTETIDSSVCGTWSCSNNAVATIGSASGIVRGHSIGVVTITYHDCFGCIAVKTISVTPLPAPITGSTVLCVGGTVTLGNVVTGGIWISNSTGIAAIGSSSGIVSGVSSGTTTVTYLLNTGCYSTTGVSVGTATSITGPTVVCTGSTITLSNSTPGGIWSTSSSVRAIVGSVSGIVSGVSAGTVVITYAINPGCISTYTIFVTTINPITGVSAVCQGQTAILIDVTSGGVWSSSDAAIAAIGTTTGTSTVVTGITAGTVTITYYVSGGCYATRSLVVNPLSTISGSSTVCTGQTITLTNATPGGVWTSGNTTIAQVGSLTGLVSGVLGGATSISYTTTTGCRAVFPITVATLTAISGLSSVCQGQTIALTHSTSGGTWSSSSSTISVGTTSGIVMGVSAGTAIISYSLGSGCVAVKTITITAMSAISSGGALCLGQSILLTNATPGGLWSSSTPVNATIGSLTGLVTGLRAGNSTISYTVGGCRALQTVTVVNVSAIFGPTTVCSGQTITLTNIYGGGIWSSSATGVATIGSTGMVTGVSAGTAIISYAIGTGACVSTTTITVHPFSPITGSTSVCVGQTVTLFNATSGGRWTSSNPTIGAIGSLSGLVSGLTGGSVTISYTISSTGCRATLPFTVNRLSAIAGPATVCAGQTITLTNTDAGIWTSSNLSAATIGSTTGLITGGTSGTAIITYTLSTGCVATKVVTVYPLSPITGMPADICTSGIETLANATPGTGIWTSGNSTIARVGSLTGIVTGLLSGTTTIAYRVDITGCRTTVPVVVINCRIGATNNFLPEKDGKSVFSLMPNPNKGEFTIKGSLASVRDEEATIEVVDMLGQIIHKSKVTVTNGEIYEQIKLMGNFSNGMYLLNLRTDTETKVFHFVIGR